MGCGAFSNFGGGKESFVKSNTRKYSNARKTFADTSEFDPVQEEFEALLNKEAEVKKLWKIVDINNNNRVSLAEISKYCKERQPILNHSVALMRAYKFATNKDGGGDGSDFIDPPEFRTLLLSIVYFNRLFKLFTIMDSGILPKNRKIEFDEFAHGCKVMGLKLPENMLEKAFKQIDRNHGACILFDELCIWQVQVLKKQKLINHQASFLES